MTVASRDLEPLRDVRILELGDGVAGAAAAAQLARLGAAVTTLADPASPMRRTSPLVGAPPDGDQSIVATLFDLDKTITTDAGRVDLGAFDVVVCDRVSGPAPLTPSGADRYVAFVERVNSGVWVTISGFGLVGPRRDEAASELVVAAAGGLLSVVSDADTGRPIPIAGSQALLSTGQAAALAVCHALSRHRIERRAVHVDLSAQAATLAAGPLTNVVARLLDSTPTGGEVRFAAPAGFYRCCDGLLRVSALEEHQWRGLTEAFDQPGWRERFPTPADRIEHADEIDALIEEITRARTKADCEAVLQAAGVPTAAMGGPRELLDSAQFAARSSLSTRAVGGRELTYVASPFRVETCDRSEPREGPGHLQGLRVVEAGHVLAVPLAGALLGAMGADVVRIEDPDRIDLFRRNAPFVDDEPGEERAVYYAMVNHSKRSVAMSYSRHADVLHDVLDRGEVLLENLGPGRAAKFGLAADQAQAAHPRLLAVSSSAYGHQGPWSKYRAYAYTLHTACGPLHLTRSASGEPARLVMAWADLIAGYAIATLVAAWALGDRQGAALDFSMAELVAARFNEFLAAEALALPYPDAHGSDDRLVDVGDGFVALSPSADDQRAAAAHLLADPALRAAPEGLVDELHRAGVPAAVVADAERLVDDEQLAAFGLYTEVEHPTWGRRRIVGLPWRFVGEPAVVLAAPPRFGATARIADDEHLAGDLWPAPVGGG